MPDKPTSNTNPAIEKIKKQLRKTGEKTITLNTPEGPKPFRYATYQDPQGNTIIELEGLETDDYILIPKQTLRQILQEAKQQENQ